MVNKKKHRTVKITGIHTIKVPYEHKFIVDDDLDVNEFDWDKFIDAGTVSKEDLDLFKIVDDVDTARDFLVDEITKHYKLHF